MLNIFKNGELIYQDKSLKEKQEYCEKEWNSLYPEVTRITNPHGYYVDLSDTLRELKNGLIRKHTRKNKEKRGRI